MQQPPTRVNGLTVEEIANPLPRSSFGGVGSFIEVKPSPGKDRFQPTLLSIPYSDEKLGWVDPASLRVFEFDAEQRGFRLVQESRVDLERRVVFFYAEKPGIYGLFGLPRDMAAVAAVHAFSHHHEQLFAEQERGVSALQHSICQRILCAGPLWFDVSGPGIPAEPGADICEFCLGLEIPQVGLPERQLFEPRPPKTLVAPTTERIVYASNHGIHPHRDEIYIIGADGSGKTRLTHTPGFDNTQPRWSPDGQNIAFASNRRGLGFEIWVADAYGISERNLSNRGQWGVDLRPDWSPDGKRLVFSSAISGRDQGRHQIWTMDTAGGAASQVVASRPGHIGHLGSLYPAWSAQNRIVYSSDRTGNFEIYAVDPDGSNEQQLTSDPSYHCQYPAWSPGGDKIAYVRSEVVNPINPDIFVMDDDGSNARRLTSEAAADMHPAWSPDGQKIAFASNRMPSPFEIWVMNAADGTNKQKITNDQDVSYFPDWVRGSW